MKKLCFIAALTLLHISTIGCENKYVHPDFELPQDQDGETNSDDWDNDDGGTSVDDGDKWFDSCDDEIDSGCEVDGDHSQNPCDIVCEKHSDCIPCAVAIGWPSAPNDNSPFAPCRYVSCWIGEKCSYTDSGCSNDSNCDDVFPGCCNLDNCVCEYPVPDGGCP